MEGSIAIPMKVICHFPLILDRSICGGQRKLLVCWLATANMLVTMALCIQWWIVLLGNTLKRMQGSRGFKLWGLLMWTIFDFSAYDLISGLCCKGYKRCPPCGPETKAHMARTGDVLSNCQTRSSKIVYGGIRHYLPWLHPYRRNKRFNGANEHRTALFVVSGIDIIRYAVWWQSYLDLGGKENGKDDPVHVTGVKCLSSFYEFPYSYPEGSIAKGYWIEDMLGFCMEYMKQYRSIT